ncbi:hypothetical protein [Gilvibacter sp.]|uniref:hypothetical protein n=1 Tax=Gilvibacter sp. TaxID=2729997 RepID=UPI0025BECDAA|nr:hypothetical protein [Gilvibacter sp.]
MAKPTKPIRKFTYVQLLLLHIGMAITVYFFRPSSTIFLLGSFAIFTFYVLAKGY